MNPIAAGFFSMTGGALSGDDTAYLRWHALDHLPEQYSILGIRLGTRWRADDACVAARLTASEALAPIRHAVCYFMTEPIEDTLVEFGQLGRRCAEQGRFPERASSFLLGAFALDHARAAARVLVSTEALPFRPHRGVYVIVETVADPADEWLAWLREEHVSALLSVDGVAGVYAFRSGARLGTGPDQGERFGVAAWDPGDRLITVVYLDDDVLAAAARLEPLVRGRWTVPNVAPQLAGPFRAMVTHAAWPEDQP